MATSSAIGFARKFLGEFAFVTLILPSKSPFLTHGIGFSKNSGFMIMLWDRFDALVKKLFCHIPNLGT